MGIDINSYRARIGIFRGGGYGTSKSAKFGMSSSSETSTKGCWILLFLLLCGAILQILLLRGGVEENPGPNRISHFQCKKCEFKCKTTIGFVRHQYLHSQDRNFKFLCPKPMCPYVFRSHEAFRVHLYRFHAGPVSPSFITVVADNQPSPNTRLCGLCSEAFMDAAELRKHLASHIENGEPVLCPFESCKRHKSGVKFCNVGTFRVHWSEYHTNQNLLSGMGQATDINNGRSSPSDHHELRPPIQDSSDEESDQHELAEEPSSYESRLVDCVAKFYLKLETVYHVPSSTVQMICEDICKLTEMTQQSVAAKLKSCLENENIDEDTVKSIVLSVLDADVVHKIHHKGLSNYPLMTRHLRSKYYKLYFKFTAPTRIFLGFNKFGKRKYAHYVPIKESVSAMLEDESVKAQVRESFNRTSSARPGVYSDYTDGECYRSKFAPKFNKAIHLIVFQDGLELVNPLGAARVKHKAIGVYFTLGNLAPKCRSKVHTLCLAEMFFEKDLKQFSHKKMFGRFVKDLKKLEKEGIMFDGNLTPVVLVVIVGDNLGSHMVGGFQESFRVEYFCRYCEITRQAFKRKCHDASFKLRTIDSYNKCAAAMDILKQSGIKTPSAMKGIKFSSIFNEIGTYHVCNPGLPPCIAHDFYLGVVPKDLGLFIKYFVTKVKWFTYETLNQRIAAFPFKGNDARDRPPTLTEKKHKVIGSAVQNWNLLRFFSLIVGDLVQDPNDEVWKLYLRLKLMGEFIAAPDIHESQITHLDIISEEYLYDLVRCKKLKASVICKHHFCRHVALLIFLFGPLCRLWTLHFEAKHSWMRQAALAAKNFVHVTHTLVEKHQLLFAYLQTGVLFPDDIECSSLSPLHISKFTDRQRIAIEEYGINIQSAFEAKAVGKPPIQYKKGLWIVLRHDDDGLHLGLIVALILDETGCHYLLLNRFSATFNSNFGHYEVNERFVSLPESIIIPLKNVKNFYPLNDYVLNRARCITLKYSVLRREDLV